jgi:hypothetical protein
MNKNEKSTKVTRKLPFLHVCEHTGILQSDPLHCEGHAHVSGPTQLPPKYMYTYI